MAIDNSPLAFYITNNVYITVLDKFGNIKKEIETHNKCNRTMVTGILRFLCGHFTDTNCNENPPYNTAKNYIPCYFGVGDGGVELDTTDAQNPFPKSKPGHPNIPKLDNKWNQEVNYLDTSLEREFFVLADGTTTNSRTKFQDVTTTILQPSVASMDSIYFYCQIPPAKLNEFYGNRNVFVTELGLFSGNVCGTHDLLAKVKLANYNENEEDDDEQTNALYVRPQDTVVVRWIVSIAAIGIDDMFESPVENEYGDRIKTDVTPVTGEMEFEILN